MEKNDLEEKELKEADMEFERKEKNLLLPTKEIIKIKVSTKELWIQKSMSGTKTMSSVKFVWKILYIMLSENVVIIIVAGIACWDKDLRCKMRNASFAKKLSPKFLFQAIKMTRWSKTLKPFVILNSIYTLRTWTVKILSSSILVSTVKLAKRKLESFQHYKPLKHI